jgi:hypothetical protein
MKRHREEEEAAIPLPPIKYPHLEDLSLPIELWTEHIMPAVHPESLGFKTWYNLIRSCRTLWKLYGGMANIRTQWPGLCAEHLIKLSDFVPAGVIERIKALPEAAFFKSMPALPVGMGMPHIAGGYVRVAVLKALREEGLTWVSPRLILPAKGARDIDVFFSSRLVEWCSATRDLLSELIGTWFIPDPHASSDEPPLWLPDPPDSTVWRYRPSHDEYFPAVRGKVDCILDPASHSGVSALDPHILSFDYTCTQFQLDDMYGSAHTSSHNPGYGCCLGGGRLVKSGQHHWPCTPCRRQNYNQWRRRIARI